MTDQNLRSALTEIRLPDGRALLEADVLRALREDAGRVSFVLEARTAEEARALEPVRTQIEAALRAVPGVEAAQGVLTAPAEQAKPVKLGRHPSPQQGGPQAVSGIDRIIAVGSGKGGVGKSTVSSNLAVALARQGRRVGLLDADIYGPSQPRMMGVSDRPGLGPDKQIEPLVAHGVKLMSIGVLVDPDQAVIWRGPMLMGALQQLLGQVNWAPLDVLIIDLPPGTGDIQLSLAQRTKVTGAVIVSTPQDVALLDARKAIGMFGQLKVPVLGLIENMASFVCPACGHEAHPFGHGGVRAEADKLGLPFLGALPLDLDTRLAGDAGTPIAAGQGAMADAYMALARRMIDGGMG